MRYIVLIFYLLFAVRLQAQSPCPATDYEGLKAGIVARFRNTSPGKFGHFVKGTSSVILTDQKIVALTFDACGGPTGSGYDEELICLLREQKIPATLFVTGSWIDANLDLVTQLSRDSLFEIENHGLDHCPCSINGRSKYGIMGTEDAGRVVDEIELNARKIEAATCRKPIYYRPATATADEACVGIATALGERVVSFDVLSGDAVEGTPAEVITGNILKSVRNGAIVIMHMNHPERNGYEGLKEAIPQLVKKGYTFVRLQHSSLKSAH